MLKYLQMKYMVSGTGFKIKWVEGMGRSIDKKRLAMS